MSRKSKAAEFLDVGYNINVTGRNVQVTDAMKNYAMDKISKLERFSHRVIDVNVIMDIQRYQQRVDIVIRLDNTKIRSSATTDDMYASIDKAVDRIKEQLLRYKTRIQNHQSVSHDDVAMNVNVYKPSDDISEVNDDIDEANRSSVVERYQPHHIVKKESRPLKTLNTSEAILKMELSGDAFLIFRCEEDRKLKVIYVREDGNFGVIEAE